MGRATGALPGETGRQTAFLVDIPAPASWRDAPLADVASREDDGTAASRAVGSAAAKATPSLAAAFAACAIFSTPLWIGGWGDDGGARTADALASARAGAEDAAAVSGGTVATDEIVASAIATATIASDAGDAGGGAAPSYLSGRALRQLLAERPVKCVLPTASGDIAPTACAETVAYRPSAALFTREAPAATGGRVEVNAAYSIEDDALCHHTAGLSVLVIGDARPPRPPVKQGGAAEIPAALSLEALLEAHYAAHAGAPICHRLTALGASPNGPLFRADALRDGAVDPARSDPRPFVMRRAAL
ncbi:MAG: hypothetical protein AAF909_03205 [Pseudomonadota bacterium]